jgi:hypothetical protein
MLWSFVPVEGGVFEVFPGPDQFFVEQGMLLQYWRVMKRRSGVELGLAV